MVHLAPPSDEGERSQHMGDPAFGGFRTFSLGPQAVPHLTMLSNVHLQAEMTRNYNWRGPQRSSGTNVHDNHDFGLGLLSGTASAATIRDIGRPAVSGER